MRWSTTSLPLVPQCTPDLAGSHQNASKLAKQEFEHMLDLSIIRPSSSPWALPLHMVP